MSTRLNQSLMWAAIVAAMAVTPALTLAQRDGGAPAAAQGAPGAGARGGGGRGAANLPPAGPAPRLSNGKPDLSGHWNNPYTPDMAAAALDVKTRMPLQFARLREALPDARPSATGRGGRTLDLPYTERGLKQWKEYDPVNKGDYAGTCLPFGMSRNINSPHGTEIVQSNDALALLFEQNTWFHWVPTKAGFKWPADIPDSWNGLSVGHWDGDTLVVETKGFNGYTKLDTAGHPMSKDLVITNTFLRSDSNTIQHTVTVHDPKTYTQDWMNVRTWRLKPAADVVMEYSCEENNLDNIINGAIKRWTPPEDEN
ncbi:MAG TPA: hypothetical protein VMZ90_01360 [Vicinamibacterales bacterium]|nr:hypothetical protein [Vicinamibacterales bacterium]